LGRSGTYFSADNGWGVRGGEKGEVTCNMVTAGLNKEGSICLHTWRRTKFLLCYKRKIDLPGVRCEGHFNPERRDGTEDQRPTWGGTRRLYLSFTKNGMKYIIHRFERPGGEGEGGAPEEASEPATVRKVSYKICCQEVVGWCLCSREVFKTRVLRKERAWGGCVFLQQLQQEVAPEPKASIPKCSWLGHLGGRLGKKAPGDCLGAPPAKKGGNGKGGTRLLMRKR